MENYTWRCHSAHIELKVAGRIGFVLRTAYSPNDKNNVEYLKSAVLTVGPGFF